MGFAVVLPIVLVGLLAWRRSAIGFGAIVCVVVVWLGVNMVAFSQGIWLGAALPIAAAAPPTILFGSAQIWLGRRRGELVVDPNDTVAEGSAYTAIISYKLQLKEGPELIMNSDYGATDVPVPAGIRTAAQIVLSD